MDDVDTRPAAVMEASAADATSANTVTAAADPMWSGRQPYVIESSKPGVFAVGEGSVVVSSVHQVLALA